jgi:hypothetical protein
MNRLKKVSPTMLTVPDADGHNYDSDIWSQSEWNVVNGTPWSHIDCIEYGVCR